MLIVRRFISSCSVRVIFLYKLGRVQVPVFSRGAGIQTRTVEALGSLFYRRKLCVYRVRREKERMPLIARLSGDDTIHHITMVVLPRTASLRVQFYIVELKCFLLATPLLFTPLSAAAICSDSLLYFQFLHGLV